MSDPVSSIRNLGPKSDAEFARAGIDTAEQLCTLGADAAYAKLIAAGTRPHFIGYYALVMALQGRPWNDCQGSEKSELRKRFDAIKAGSAKAAEARGNLPSDVERILNQIGVRQT